MTAPWDIESRERQLALREKIPFPHARGGDSTPKVSAAVPTLRPGADRLPTRCSSCGNGLLSQDQPLGKERFGTLTCAACGELLAHLAAPLRSLQARPAPTTQPLARRVYPPTPLSVPEWRLPGCAIACRPRMHDPRTHEIYGRQQALAEIGATATAQAVRPTGEATTGPLRIDFESCQAILNGKRLRLTVNEFALLQFLAAHLDIVCTNGQIVEAVWGREQLALWAHGRRSWHGLRVHVTRLRAKLGEYRTLIETATGIGYRLLSEPPA